MKWKRVDNYLVYINEENINDFISTYKINSIDNKIKLEEEENIRLENINNVVYYPKIYRQSTCNIPTLKSENNGEKLNNIYSIKAEIAFRIEYFSERIIKTKVFNIEFNDFFVTNKEVNDLKIYINTMAINFNVIGELIIPVIYTIYTKNYM